MDILITGSTGFLGKIIFDLLKKNHNVFGLSKSNSYYNCDLINSTIKFEISFDIVVHCAGIAHNSKIQNIYSKNLSITKNLLTSFKNSKNPQKIIFISSVSVYGLDEGLLIKETHPLLAKDQYGLSKLESESLLNHWCKLNNVSLTILRLPLIAGPNPPGNLGSMINGIQKGFYFNIQGGNFKKSIVLASDIANQIIEISKNEGIYNLTDGYHPTIFELSNYISQKLINKKAKNINYFLAKLIAIIGDIFGNNFPLNSIKLKKITSSLTFDDSKARNTFNWHSNPILKNFEIK